MPHLLIVDPNPAIRSQIAELAMESGCSCAQAADLRQARIQFGRHRPNLVITELNLADGSGTALFEEIRGDRAGAVASVVVLAEQPSLESAIEALRLGAVDYLTKPLNRSRVQTIVAQLAGRHQTPVENANLTGQLRRYGRFGQMIGASSPMQRLYDQIARVAPTEATVLLIGESGTGKELVAQTIHDLSQRRRQPFLAVNCGAISPNLIESEMFGHERGSFTGAERQHKGYFERASGGSLFLDEITEMPPELQVKLLRVLETGVFMRVGTNKEALADVRIIAATNRDPQQAVAEGKLRADLYHRLNVFPLLLPALRDRDDDIDMLAQSFLDLHNEAASQKKTFSPAFVASIRDYSWPGNIRELKNYVHRAWIMSDEQTIDVGVVPLPAAGQSLLLNVPTLTFAVGSKLAQVEQQLIAATLDYCGGNRKQAAELLGVSAKNL